MRPIDSYLALIASRPRRYAFILLSGLILAAVAAQTPVYGQLARWLEDAVHGLTAERIRFEDVLVIDIDEPAMARLEPTLGAWPYPRHIYAELLDFLAAAGARTVVFDILMVERRPGDDAFAAALSRGRGALLAARGQQFGLARDQDYFERLDRHAWSVTRPLDATRWRDILLPSAQLDAAAGTGIISVTPDADGVLRRVALLHEAYGRVLPAMPLAALFSSAGAPEVRVTADVLQVAGQRWPLDGAGNVMIRVPRNRDFLRIVGFDDVLAAARGEPVEALDPEQVRGRTVFIGSSAAVLGDYARVPVHGRTAGLGILALAFACLAHGLVVHPPMLLLDLLLILVAAALPLLYTNRRDCSELTIAFWALMGVSVALTVHIAAFGWFHLSSDAAFAITAALFVTVIQFSMRFRTLYDERRQLWLGKRAADEANALKSRFLAHMTHELRTPLTAIMGYNRLLAEPGVSDDERRQRTAVVERNGHHLLALINNLLDQAKIEAGQMTVEPEPARIRELLEDCEATLAPLAHAKGLDLQMDCDESVPAVLSLDALRVRQILLNLAGNAIKFTEQGRVKVFLEWVDARLDMRVTDTGPGMSAAALGRIFEAFQQADSTITRSHGGTGLGLTISRNLAQMMGGGIRVDSEEGQGTRFSVTLDAPVAVLVDEGAQDAAARAVEPESIQAHVLLADDTEDIRELVGLQLRRLGLKVSTASDGREAVDRTLELGPDLVLMDVEMPVMNGLDATVVLRESGYQGVVLALTAHGDEEFLARTREAGCDGILAKPLPKARLAAAMQQYLGTHRGEA